MVPAGRPTPNPLTGAAGRLSRRRSGRWRARDSRGVVYPRRDERSAVTTLPDPHPADVAHGGGLDVAPADHPVDWWRRPGLDVAAGRLTIAGRDAEALAREHGVPLFVYDITHMEELVRAMQGPCRAPACPGRSAGRSRPSGSRRCWPGSCAWASRAPRSSSASTSARLARSSTASRTAGRPPRSATRAPTSATPTST